MSQLEVLPDVVALAEAAASAAISELQRALAEYSRAVWVLAGGSSPMAAYRLIAADHRDRLRWDSVTFLVGDERCVPEDDPASNWGQLREALLDPLGIPESNRLRPIGELSAEACADDYEQQLARLPAMGDGHPRLDHVWLGLGEDGHTLSLFPGHPGATNMDRLVTPVHNSPKPPPDRISLTLRALQGARSCLIVAAGQEKAEAVARAQARDTGLPIVRAVEAVESSGGRVQWLIDREAASGL